ncbi:MAG: hypothetical protein PUE12_06700 [Oscillospiraceae bacterium]|nr:hypothetical protein [Oscillospiraceae bacterium]
MKYFCTPDERKGTCYYEFQRGGFNEEFWLDDSILIHDDVWYDSGLEDFFCEVIPDIDLYGTVEVNEEMWSRILEKSGDYEESVKEALIELDEWVRDNFNEHEVFTIAGL